MAGEATLVSSEQLQALLGQAEEELQEIQPNIEQLEQQIQQLQELKQRKQRLLTFKMSISTLLDNIHQDNALGQGAIVSSRLVQEQENDFLDFETLSSSKTFHPEEALNRVQHILKQKSSLNYEMFKAVVFLGGKASTEEIKTYLVEGGIRQPQTGESFEAVPLTEISSRVNYLVRKGILKPLERGLFYTPLGWMS